MKLKLLIITMLLALGAKAQTWSNFNPYGAQWKITGLDTTFRLVGSTSGKYIYPLTKGGADKLYGYTAGYGMSLVGQQFRVDTAIIAAKTWVNIKTPFVTPEMYGAVGDGVTDDKAAIQAAINSGKQVQLMKKRYYISSSIELIAGSSITGTGTGTGTNIYITANAPAFLIKGSNINIDGISILGDYAFTSGSYTTTKPNQHGIAIINPADFSIDYTMVLRLNCTFYNMSGGGIYSYYNVGGTPTNIYAGAIQATNNVAFGCYTGYYNDARAEYNTFVNCKAYSCAIGYRSSGGNNIFTGGILNSNNTGAYLESGPNHGHAYITSSSLNHNVEYGVWASAVTLGYTISNCAIYANDILIENSNGIKISDCDISISRFYVQNSTLTEFKNNKLPTTPELNLSWNGTDNTGTPSVVDFFNNKYWLTIPAEDNNSLQKGLSINSNDGTPNGVVRNVDLDSVKTSLSAKQLRTPIYFKGKQVVFFGDSYTAGSGASSNNRWTTVFSRAVGAIEINNGVPGTTLEKRSPIDYMASPNMVDRISDIPTKTAAMAMLTFAFGLNDVGYVGGQYSPANYKLDYATVLNAALAKGWLPSQILIIPAYYIGQDGYDVYATITGNAAPTRARHLDFINAAKEVSDSYGTMYINIFNDQIKNDTTLIVADKVHPNDAGYEYIANDVLQFLGQDKIGFSRSETFDLTPGYVLNNTFGNKLSNSLIYDTGSSVGVGTISPNTTFNVNSTSPEVSLGLTTSSTGGSGSDGSKVYVNSGNDLNIINLENKGLILGTSNSQRVKIDSAGFVLINQNASDNTNVVQVTGGIKATAGNGGANDVVRNSDLSDYVTTNTAQSITGNKDITGAQLLVATQSARDSTNKAASTEYVDKTISSGTYTPTLTIFNNASAVTADLCHYIKVGGQVTVTGTYTTTTIATATNTVIKVSLPIASNFTAANDLRGSGSLQYTSAPASVYADASPTDDVALVYHGSTPALTSGVVTYFTFTYTIK